MLVSQNTDGFFSLQQNVNKWDDAKTLEVKAGVSSPMLPELELDMTEEELISLSKKWVKMWKPFAASMKTKQDNSEKYWLGKSYQTTTQLTDDKPMANNIIFENLETLLALVIGKSPDASVESDNTPEGNALAEKVQSILKYLADELSLQLQLQVMARYWSMYYLGVAKIGWSQKSNDIDLAILRPQKLIMDPAATIVNGIYQGEFIGEFRRDSATNLANRFPKKKSYISDLVKDEMGTDVTYIEWWTDDYLFWTVDDNGMLECLGKAKNPHWNYTGNPIIDPQTGQPTPTPAYNHFKSRQKPFVFLSVFNLGLTPFDDTSLIDQTKGLQDLTSKRLRQIDKNADGTNGGAVVSGDHFTKEQAGKVADALRYGGTSSTVGVMLNSAPSSDPMRFIPILQ